MILTFDWAPVMRIIAMACQDMGIPCILIPHESVFVDRTKYYWDPKSHGSVPVADVVLGWGGLQREIFVERGYPAERFIAVGAPKFDAYHSMEPLLTREAFARLFGLDPQKKIALFATQPLDSQLDTKTARAAQRAAILDLAKALLDMDGQLIVRLPPSKDNILGSIVEKKLAELGNVAVDDAQCYLVPPEEAIYHSDLVTSINSTMLFEALLAGRPSLSLKYTEFDQIWRHAGIPAVTSAEELRPAVEQLLSGEWKPSEEGMRWAASQFSCGEFDGKAAERIRNFLRDVATGTRVIDSRGSAFERLLRRDIVDVAAIPNAENLSSHLKAMLGTRTLISSNLEPLEMPHVATVDIFIQWGITPTKNKQRQAELAKRLGRPTVIVEDGFLRSLDIGLSGEPALSIILDTKTAYYDATRVSWLAEQLEHGREITEAERRRARAAIEAIVSNRLSKYNHAPDIPLQIGDRRRKVLVLDQRFGDESVRSGLADESTFDRMLYDAIKHRADCDIIVKLHPDAIKGGKGSYLAPDRYPFLKFVNNVYFVDFDVNPHSLFDIVDEVFVVTSGMGFEALMAGKTVHCYGMPYYAGWGVTDDRQTLPTRTRKRSVEEIFHFAYIEASRYYSPKLGRACEIEDLIAYLAENTGFRKNDGDRMAA